MLTKVTNALGHTQEIVELGGKFLLAVGTAPTTAWVFRQRREALFLFLMRQVEPELQNQGVVLVAGQHCLHPAVATGQQQAEIDGWLAAAEGGR